MKNLLFGLLMTLSFSGLAQVTEEQAVIKTIETLFDGMRTSDTTKIVSVVHKDASLRTTYLDKEGNPQLHVGDMAQFIGTIAKPHDEIYDERIWSYEVEIDGLLATAWTEYTFFLDEKMSHCGVNAFHLFKAEDGWKIIAIIDTRYREGCRTEPLNHEAAIDTLMDNWHKAAATADEDVFFGTMSVDGIYLGTDASERWARDEMKKLMQPYFDKESAWAFTASERKIYFSNDGKTAWFEELLDTWMGDCRGSGVLELTAKGWELKHYNLAILVPNDVVKDYLELIKKE